MDETGPAPGSPAEHDAMAVLTRHALGLGVLLLTVIPAYLTSGAGTAAPEVAEVVSAAPGDDDADEAETDVLTTVEIEAHIREIAIRNGISPLLVAAIVEAESEFKPRAVSRKGARGLMQLMPATASSLRVEDTFDPYENIQGGVRHLRRLMERFNGDLPLVLAAYNAGEQTVAINGGVPPYPETRRYVVRILRRIGRGDLAAGVNARRSRAKNTVGTVAVSFGSMRRLERQALEREKLPEMDPGSAATSGNPPPSADERPATAVPKKGRSAAEGP